MVDAESELRTQNEESLQYFSSPTPRAPSKNSLENQFLMFFSVSSDLHSWSYN
jgi:hypothetical protein